MLTLVGGGSSADARQQLYEPFLTACGISRPRVAVVVVEASDGSVDGAQQADEWAETLTSVLDCRPEPVVIGAGEQVAAAALDLVDGVFVGGGLTPAYAAALAPVAGLLRRRVGVGMPYAGFSAGAAIAADRALLGGWRATGRPVCPEATAEDEDELLVGTGLGLVGYAVDAHCAQWGTLGRAVAAVGGGRLDSAWALDEDTALVVDTSPGRTPPQVVGLGAAWHVTRDGSRVVVERVNASAPR